MVKVLRELSSNPVVEMGKTYAYEYKGRLHVGTVIKNPTEGGYSWVMENLVTGKIEYPYTQDIFIPEEPCSRVILTYDTVEAECQK